MPNRSPQWKTPALVFVYYTAAAILLFSYKYLDFVSRAYHKSPAVPLLEELTGAYSAMLLLPVIVLVARRFPLLRGKRAARLPLHFATAVSLSLVHTWMMKVSRELLFPALGMGSYDYGIMRARYPMEASNDLLGYALLVSLIYLFDHYRATREREVLTAQLETRLAQAQLQNLRLQLQPHFLFNSLNMISSVMYENPRAADELISRLSDLLRISLQDSGAQEVPLDREIKTLDLYLDIMRARFEDRLAFRLDLEPGAGQALVPQLLLQPLVENSLRHGVDPVSSTVDVAVSARRSGDELRIEVRDRGRGLNGGELKRGIGLSNTADRLARLYGGDDRLSLENAAGGGLVVRMRVPFHTRPEPA